MDEQNFQNFIFTLGSNVGNQHTDKLCCDIYYYYHNRYVFFCIFTQLI